MIINHKSVKRNERFNGLRQAKVNNGFTWKNHVYQIDKNSLVLITGRALKIIKKKILGEPLPTVEWITKDNQKYTFTGVEFIAFAEAVDDYVDALYLESHQRKKAS